MAFERKWVSDTNLDKLWNDTIEKKEANKQRRSPDFCKEAILSATLKRISSEMLMRRLSSPSEDIDLNSDDEDSDSITVLANVSGLMDCDEHVNFEVSSEKCDKESTESNPAAPSNDQKENCLTELCNAIEMADIETVPKSPKRKWSDTDDNDAEIHKPSVTCSPAKRSRPKKKSSQKNDKPLTPRRKRSQSPICRQNSIDTECFEKTKKRLFNLPKVKIIPADDDNNSSQNSEINMTLLTPVRSVANSISELSIEVDEPKDDSWCLKVAEPIHTDPLELDGFFSNLRKVTS